MIYSDVEPIRPVYHSESSSAGEQAIGASGTGEGRDQVTPRMDLWRVLTLMRFTAGAHAVTDLAIAVRVHGASDYSPPLPPIV